MTAPTKRDEEFIGTMPTSNQSLSMLTKSGRDQVQRLTLKMQSAATNVETAAFTLLPPLLKTINTLFVEQMPYNMNLKLDNNAY